MSSDRDAFFREVGHLLSPEEAEQLKRAGMGRRIGFGRNPALLIIDAQNYMIGATDAQDQTVYPSACVTAREAAPEVVVVVPAGRYAAATEERASLRSTPGSTTRKMLPRPGVLFTSTVPPRRVANCLTM